MKNPIENFWRLRLEDLKTELEANNFEVFIADNPEKAKDIVLEDILPKVDPKSVSWGGSMTFAAVGLYEVFMNRNDLVVIDTMDRTVPREEFLERRRQALLVDLFITGTGNC